MPKFEKSKGFEMKGSPMQRNFGIGGPIRNEKEKKRDEQANKGKFSFSPDFSDEKQKELYAKSAEYREYLKNKGITYDAKTNKSTHRTSVVKGSS